MEHTVNRPNGNSSGDEGFAEYEAGCRRKRRISVLLWLVAATVALGLILFWFLGMPAVRYRAGRDSLKAGDYADAYEDFLLAGEYEDSREKADFVLRVWLLDALDSTLSGVAQELAITAEISAEQYEMVYRVISGHIENHPNAAYWMSADGRALQTVDNVYTLLKILPEGYENVSELKSLFSVLRENSDGSSRRSLQRLFAQHWEVPLVQDIALRDYAITAFLWDTWTADAGSIRFYEKSSGEALWCEYDLPTPERPEETSHYAIKDGVFWWVDGENEYLTQVFAFEILNYDTVTVFCFADGNSCTMEREGA